MAIQQQSSSTTVEYVELPELRETFADSIHTMVWDGQTLRVEFSVTRYPEAPAAGEAKRYPACRLVLTAAAVTDLFNRVQQTMAALAKSGAASQQRPPSAPNS
jgi:hypothetical protein